jgi:hypothetical protein
VLRRSYVRRIFFLGWLEDASKNYAIQAGANPEHLEYWFSA